MSIADEFVDYYETLEVSQSASPETIVRVYRHLAQLHHPDNQDTGDRDRFDKLVEAYNTLKDAAKRAEYDILYDEYWDSLTGNHSEPSNTKIIARDVETQSRLLSMFYVKRRQNIRDPGVPEFELERTFECTIEELEFHLWYLREKGWISKLENGMFSITIGGIDHINSEHHRKISARMLTDQHESR